MSRSSKRSDIMSMLEGDNTSIVLAFVAVAILGLIIYWISSCGCHRKRCHRCGYERCRCLSRESYVPEFSGNNPNYKSCTNSYRLYMDSADDTYTYPRNRCQFCKGYNNYSYEGFEPCAHNCRQYGVSLCDQGKMM